MAKTILVALCLVSGLLSVANACCFPLLMHGSAVEISRFVNNPETVVNFPSHPDLNCGLRGSSTDEYVFNIDYAIDFSRRQYMQQTLGFAPQPFLNETRYMTFGDSQMLVVDTDAQGVQSCRLESTQLLELLFPGIGDDMQCYPSNNTPLTVNWNNCDANEYYCGLLPTGSDACDRLEAGIWYDKAEVLVGDPIAGRGLQVQRRPKLSACRHVFYLREKG